MVHGAVAARRAGASGDRIGFLGHSTVTIELDGVRLLTDPLLRGRVAHLRRQVPAVDRRASAAPAAVLISHAHHDHLDLPSLRDLGLDTPLLVPAGAGAWLRRKGFTTVTELIVGATARVGSVAVTAVPAYHDGRRIPGVLRAAAVGYLVRGRRTVYFAGDTELFDDMSQLGPRPDVALLPVAGWAPRLGPGHMNPLQAARAAALLRPRMAIPIHWGTLLPIGMAGRHRAALGDPPRRFAEHVARLAPGIQVCILSPGEEAAL
ncbi:MAG TPA: MBL fold metallo-hydrolase [Solirubrobacteraceae bacterium]|nr:MBL fold metallo-hydrolase [Solirubrobacteraceae bacterium]